jgi:hypothetical protein
MQIIIFAVGALFGAICSPAVLAFASATVSCTATAFQCIVNLF